MKKDGDTVKLLRECDAGIKMGISSIDDVIYDVKDKSLRDMLDECKRRHEVLSIEVGTLLDDHFESGKNPNPMAKSMSFIKTNVKMMASPKDSTVADLMTDGCNMGVKSLGRYLNQYKNADEKSRAIAKNLINLESSLAVDLRNYL
ncbi:MAG: hypothetical protein E7570_04775 [Ruminococcaceae bacterium]|nr:hypothetical protein [Oscillospiraceae bacterium]